MISELCGFMELAMGQRMSRTGNDVVLDHSGNRLRRLNFAASCDNHLEYRKCLQDASRSFCGGIGTGKLGCTVTPVPRRQLCGAGREPEIGRGTHRGLTGFFFGPDRRRLVTAHNSPLKLTHRNLH
jgi:hypothetical protein